MKISTKTLISLVIFILITVGLVAFAFPKQQNLKTYNLINFYTKYSKCNHTVKKSINTQPTQYSYGELKKEYSNYDINLNKNILNLTKTENNYCDKHYFAKLNDNTISIKRINDNLLIREFKVPKNIFTEDELKTLENGIYLYEADELTSFIEDYSS